MLKSKTKGAAAAIALGLMAMPIACITTGCSSEDQAVAATVNGDQIKEQTITDYIENFRASQGLTTDEDWGNYLADMGMTPEELRQQTIDYYVQMKVIDQDAASKGITVSDDEVTAQLDEIKEYYGYDDAQFAEQVESIGYTVDTYAEYVKQSLLQQKLSEAVVEEAVPSDEELLESAQSYTSILDGAKNVETIVFEATDAEKAQQVADEIAAGGDFEQLKADNSVTEEYDGWDVFGQFSETLTTAIADLQVGDVSDVITDDDYLFITKVTEICTVGEEGFASLDEVPEAIRTQISDAITASNSSAEFSNYVDELVENADVVINDMPEGLPYDVEVPETTDETTDEIADDAVTNQEVAEEELLDDTILLDENGEVVEDETTSEDIQVLEDGGTVEVSSEGTTVEVTE